MKVLIIFNRTTHDNTDVTWNGLRFAGKLADGRNEVRQFLMNGAGFKDSAIKINVEQIFKQLSPTTDVKCI